MTGKTCGTCRHSAHGSDAMECVKRPGWATWEGGACEDWVESNWQRYFGTPERTAAVVSEFCLSSDGCGFCPFIALQPCPFEARSWLEWLEADAL